MITRAQLIDALEIALAIIQDKLPEQAGLITLHQTLEEAKADPGPGVLITVEGGVVQGVNGNSLVDVFVYDVDNLKEDLSEDQRDKLWGFIEPEFPLALCESHIGKESYIVRLEAELEKARKS